MVNPWPVLQVFQRLATGDQFVDQYCHIRRSVLIQNTQNRDSRAINLKLDELIRSTDHAHDEMIDIERLPDKELKQLAKRYERIRKEWEERRTGRDRQRI